MIKLLLEYYNINNLSKTLEEYREKTNWTDWYMQGGCYNFADALYLYLNKSGEFIAVGENGTNTMVHVCLKYKDNYCDYNGCRIKKKLTT